METLTKQEDLLERMVNIFQNCQTFATPREAMKLSLGLALKKASDFEFDDIKDVLPAGWHDLDTHACCFARWMEIEGTENWLPKNKADLKKRLAADRPS